MGTRKATNVLLLLILLSLAVLLFKQVFLKELSAETLRLDDCITTSSSEKPRAYLHVVMHE